MQEIDIKDILEALWNRKYQVIAIVLIFLIIGIIYSFKIVKPVYSSTATLVLASTNTNGNNQTMTATDMSINTKLITTYKSLIKSRTVLEKVVSNLGNKISEDELRKSISIKSVTGTTLLEMTVTNKDANQAAIIANEVVKVFTSQVKDLYNIDNVQLVSSAQVSTSPSNINHLKDLILCVAIGIVLAVVYVLIANMFDTTIKSAEEIEKEFNLPVIVSIPLMTKDKKEVEINE